MRNSNDVYIAMAALQEARGTSTKVGMLKEYLQNDLFCWVVEQAVDPMIVFGVKDLSFLDEVDREEEPGGNVLGLDTFTNTGTFRTLRDVAEGQIGSGKKTALGNIYREANTELRYLLRLMLSKDLRAGVSVSTVNKARPGTVFEFNCMLAAKWEPEKLSYPVCLEPKFDGMRMLAIGDVNGFSFYTRSGKPITTVSQTLHESLCELYTDGLDVWMPESKIVFDGELMGEDFKETMEQARRKDHVWQDGVFYTFDALTIEQFSSLKSKSALKPPGYSERRKRLREAYGSRPRPQLVLPPSYIVKDEEEIFEYFAKFRARGLEGCIIKNRNGTYHPRRNRDWMKLKDSASVDVPIVDCVEGTGKYEGMMGALVVDVEGVTVNVGTGFHDGERAELWEAHNEGWLRGKIIEVEYHEKTPDGSLRHPRFVRFRNDKTLEDGVGV